MKHIKSGKTKDCLADFFRRFGKSEALWKFAGVHPDTETTWRLRGVMPVGETLLKVQHFLNLIGYQVEELQKLSPELFVIGQGVAYGIITTDAAAKELETRPDGFLRYFRGERTPMAERRNACVAIAQRHASAVEKMHKELKEKFKSLNVSEIPEENSHTGPADQLIEKFNAACAEVRELGKQLLDGPVQTRYAMRRRMCEGSEPALQLTWETLNRLLREPIKQ